MNKIALLAVAASAVIATPAMAQNVTGTINLTGSVANKCSVSPSSTATFGTTVNFGELAVANGTLRTDLATTFGTKSFQIVCNTGTPKISVDANPLQISGATTPPTGYDNSIDFTASVAVATTGTSPAPFTNDSAAAAGTATTIGGGMLANSASNVSVSTSNYRTNTLTDLLIADPSYTGNIVVVITPN